MAKYKIQSEGDGFYTVKDVPIFQFHNNRGFECGENWMNAAIRMHQNYAAQDWRPPIIIGHNQKGIEKEAVGFIDNFRLRGKRLYADLCRMPGEIVEKFKKNSYPSRSVEVLPKGQRILALALLGGTAPHFALPQSIYELNPEEESIWYRSPKMENESVFTEEQRTELYGIVGAAVAETLPIALEEITTEQDPAEDYAGIAGLRAAAAGGSQWAKDHLKSMGSKVGAGAKTGAGYAGSKAKAGYKASMTKAGEAGAAIKKEAGAAKGFTKQHKGLVGAGAAGVAGAGYLAGRGMRRDEYSFDEETLEVYDGEGNVVGKVVPTVEATPASVPNVEEVDPNLSPEAAKVGVGTGKDTTLTAAPGQPATALIEPVDREASPQFELGEEDLETYDLQRRISTLENANAILQVNRTADELQSYLLKQKQLGTPVGDIEQLITFMLGLDEEQLQQFTQNLEAAPKVSFGKTPNEIVESYDANSQELVQDYHANRDKYRALGVTEDDMKYAGYVHGTRTE